MCVCAPACIEICIHTHTYIYIYVYTHTLTHDIIRQESCLKSQTLNSRWTLAINIIIIMFCINTRVCLICIYIYIYMYLYTHKSHVYRITVEDGSGCGRSILTLCKLNCCCILPVKFDINLFQILFRTCTTIHEHPFAYITSKFSKYKHTRSQTYRRIRVYKSIGWLMNVAHSRGC
jgi:hypothetical protein